MFAGEHSGQRGFIVVGTNFNYGEDITSRGHIKVGQRCLKGQCRFSWKNIVK